MPSPKLRVPSVLAAAAVAVGLLATAGPAGAAPPPAATPSGVSSDSVQPPITKPAFGLTDDGRIITFDLNRPGRFGQPPRIKGVAAGSTIVGIDERPKTGQLYAVAKAANGTATAYTLDPTTGVATLAFPLVTATAPKTPIVLTGTRFGVDFNPVADALRITGDDGQNLRALPSDRVTQPGSVARIKGDTFVDGTLSYVPIATTPRPAATGITASAYTQNLAVTATTALFNIDTVLADLTAQAPPNDGTQTKVADVAIGDHTVQGFDITTTGTTDTGYLARSTRDRSSFKLLQKILKHFGIVLPGSPSTEILRIDLATGALTPIGVVNAWSLIDFAIDTPTPAAP